MSRFVKRVGYPLTPGCLGRICLDLVSRLLGVGAFSKRFQSFTLAAFISRKRNAVQTGFPVRVILPFCVCFACRLKESTKKPPFRVAKNPAGDWLIGHRGDRIRTCDILLPKQARYQTALHPVLLHFKGMGSPDPIDACLS